MPPPVTRCTICGNEVLKSQTYHVGDGKRACKSHEGVTDQKKQLEDKAKQQAEQERQRMLDREKQWKEEREAMVDFRPKCFCCMQTGIYESDYFYKLAVLMEKEKIKGNDINVFSPNWRDVVRKHFGLSDSQKLSIITRLTATSELAKLVKPMFKMVVDIAGLVPICQDCMEKHNVKKPELPMPSLDALAIIGAVVGPVLKVEAERQISLEN